MDDCQLSAAEPVFWIAGLRLDACCTARSSRFTLQAAARDRQARQLFARRRSSL
jgi:hypothetical protein